MTNEPQWFNPANGECQFVKIEHGEGGWQETAEFLLNQIEKHPEFEKLETVQKTALRMVLFSQLENGFLDVKYFFAWLSTPAIKKSFKEYEGSEVRFDFLYGENNDKVD